jgi:hypothetical protein
MSKAAKAQSHLNRIDPWIRRRQSGIRNVHVADFGAPIVLLAQDMHSDRPAGSEIHMRCAGRNSILGEQRSSANVKIRNDAATGSKIPLQCKWVKPESIRCACALGDQEDRYNVDGILKPSAQKAGSSGVGQNPAITETEVPHTSIGCAPS